MDRKKLIALITLTTVLVIAIVFLIFSKSGKVPRSFEFGGEIRESQADESREESDTNENESVVSSPDNAGGDNSEIRTYESDSLSGRGGTVQENSQGVNVSPGKILDPFQADETGKFFGQADEFLKKDDSEKQIIGNLPVNVYGHPDLPLYLNLQGLPKFAGSLYVVPVKDGFEILDRHEMPIKSVGQDEIVKILNEEREGSPYKSNFDSLYRVYKINDEQAESIDNDSKLEAKIGKIGNDLYAVYRNKKTGRVFDQLRKQMDDDVLSLEDIFSALSSEKPQIIPNQTTSQMTSQTTSQESGEDPEVEGVDPAKDVKLEWEEICKNIGENPSKIEWKYLLPLYGPGNYKVEGEDVRRLVPKTQPVYSTGIEDINGDGREELLIHCSMRKETEYGIGGYWAVMAPSEQGILNTACYNYGNGDMLTKNGNLFFTSLSRIKDGMAFELTESAYPKTKKYFPIRVEFLQPKGLGHSLSGKKLAEDYPNHYILEHDGQLFLVIMQDYDYLMEYARNRIKGSIRLRLEEDKISRHLVKDINEYLSDSFPYLPFSSDDWDRAKPVASLAKSNRVVTFQDFRKN